MKITQTIENDAMVIKLEGWLDIQSNKEFAEYIAGIPAQDKLILDLDGLEYISSSGIREIIKIILRQPKGSFSIINVQPTVMTVFEMINLESKVPITAKE